MSKNNKTNRESNPTTLSGLVDRFMNDDAYAERLLDDAINGDKFDDLYECIRIGLVERYDELTGKELPDLYQMIITMKVIDKRIKDITGNDDNVCWDGVSDGLFEAQLNGDGSHCSDREHFRTQTFPVMVEMAKAKANAMCVRI